MCIFACVCIKKTKRMHGINKNDYQPGLIALEGGMGRDMSGSYTSPNKSQYIVLIWNHVSLLPIQNNT